MAHCGPDDAARGLASARPVRRDRRRAYAAAALVLSTAAFAAISAAVLFSAEAVRLDVSAVNWAQRAVPDALVETMRVATYAGSAVILGPLAILAALLFLGRGRQGAAIFVVAAFAGSEILSQVLKALFQRGRPELQDPFVQLTTYAFPSGHSFGATATYGALALVFASAAAERRHRVAALAVAAMLILVVGTSRVILGRHYAFDVLAGVAGGVALVSALLLLFDRSRGAFRLDLFPGRHQQPQRAGLDP